VIQIVVSGLLAWALSQVAKVFVGLFRVGRSDAGRAMWRLIWAGGMPSSHSALITSSALAVGFVARFDSAVFGLAAVLAAIVLYDRAKLHHMYQVFQSRFPGLLEAVAADPMLRDLVGHTPAQVFVGVLIGITTAFGVRLIF
jgi:acid phosphatase family membrane protein YuiD